MMTQKEYEEMMHMLQFMAAHNYDAAAFQADLPALNHYTVTAIEPFLRSALYTRKNASLLKAMGLNADGALTDVYITFMRRLDTVAQKGTDVTASYLQQMINNIVLDMYKCFNAKMRKNDVTVTEKFWMYITDGDYSLEDAVGVDTESIEKANMVFRRVAGFKQIHTIAFLGVTVLGIPAALLAEGVNKKGIHCMYEYVVKNAAKEFRTFPVSLFDEKGRQAISPRDEAKVFTPKMILMCNDYARKVIRNEIAHTYKK